MGSSFGLLSHVPHQIHTCLDFWTSLITVQHGHDHTLTGPSLLTYSSADKKEVRRNPLSSFTRCMHTSAVAHDRFSHFSSRQSLTRSSTCCSRSCIARYPKCSLEYPWTQQSPKQSRPGRLLVDSSSLSAGIKCECVVQMHNITLSFHQERSRDDLVWFAHIILRKYVFAT